MNDNQFFATRSPETRLFVILAMTLSLLLLLSFVFDLKVRKKNLPVSLDVASQSFLETTLEAKAAYVYYSRTRTVLFAKNENARLSLASLAKIMSALVAEDLSPLYGTITVNMEALQVEGDSGLYRDEKWLLKDLLDFSLLTSSNDGIRAIALSLGALSRADATPKEIINDFVGEMNRKASELGLKNTYFWNETGLDESDVKGGAYGTVKDMNALLEYALNKSPALLAATRETGANFSSLDHYLHSAKNTNGITGEIPGLIASKTGSTGTAGGNLMIIFDPELGRPIIISILGSTESGRFDDARALIAAVMKYLNNH